MPKLIIVESPGKIKTIKKYLGRGYQVEASIGHVRDLPASKLGVDIENNFEPHYINIRGKAPLLKTLKAAAQKSTKVYLATDPDREGEAISWHLANLLGIEPSDACRITFNEVTKSAITDAFNHARPIDMDLVNAQQARRVLDRIVGYKLSPLLWKTVRKGLSAGRVQSVATRLIVDREEEIRAFEPKEYWALEGIFDHAGGRFTAKFYGKDKKKLEINSKEELETILTALNSGTYTVDEIVKSEKSVSPSAPFITSTLQQDASRRFGYQPSITMRVAQGLYEGLNIDGFGQVGLITYMRTDSTRISADFAATAKEAIISRYGAAYVPAKPRVFKQRNSSQDAHEAIRPTNMELPPEAVKASLTPQQYKIYKLIWDRFLASQMSNAIYDTVRADIGCKGYLFRATDSKLKFAGYTAVYTESSDEEPEKESKNGLPEMKEGDSVKLDKLNKEQKFTLPPPRYNYASLVRTLEELGVGRPSTYASIVGTITERGYVIREEKQLKPTELGEITTNLLKEHFADIVDVKFTASMEEELDDVEQGDRGWKDVLTQFYDGFGKELAEAEENLKDVKLALADEETDIICEKCGRNMVIKHGRFGKFLACPGFPECRNAKAIVVEAPGACPVCGAGMTQRKSKRGKIFYACANADCDFMTWDEPTDTPCPTCTKPLFKKTGKAEKLRCLNEKCADYDASAFAYRDRMEAKAKEDAEKKPAAKKKTTAKKKAPAKKKPTTKPTATKK